MLKLFKFFRVIRSLIRGQLLLLVDIFNLTIINVHRSAELSILVGLLLVQLNPYTLLSEVVLDHLLGLTIAQSDLNTTGTCASTLHMILIDLRANNVSDSSCPLDILSSPMGWYFIDVVIDYASNIFTFSFPKFLVLLIQYIRLLRLKLGSLWARNSSSSPVISFLLSVFSLIPSCSLGTWRNISVSI